MDILEKGFFDKRNVLIPFECLIDTDFGLAILVRDKFLDDKVFDKFFYHNGDNRIKYNLLVREDINPLSVIVNKPYRCDTLYKEFMENFYTEILEKSCFTALVDIIISTRSVNNLTFFILCKSEQEQQYITEKLSYADVNLNFIIKDINDLDFASYDTIFLKHTNDLDLIKKIGLKSLYIAKAGYNVTVDENGYHLNPKLVEIYPDEFIKVYEPYIMDDSFFEIG